MTTIKIKKFNFISVRPVHYIILTLVIFVVVLCTAVTIANTIQLSMFISDAQELRHEVAVLRNEQKHISARIEGQASGSLVGAAVFQQMEVRVECI